MPRKEQMTKINDSQKTDEAAEIHKRCAIYARYSSDLQRDSSIEDQIRKCREYATGRGWTIQEQHIRCDRAVSAGSMAGRDGLTALMADAKQKPRPFDYILIDDTSRLA